MLPLKFCKMCFDSHVIHRFVSSDAKALRTFDWEIPNCRAIRDGVMSSEFAQPSRPIVLAGTLGEGIQLVFVSSAAVRRRSDAAE